MKFKRAGIITRIVIAALIAYAAISLAATKAKTEEISKAKERLTSEVGQLERENAAYQYEIDHSGDPETIEDIARNKLGLVRPGEKIFYDISK